jgi:hypothetical protein
MGVKPIETTIAATTPDDVRNAIKKWEGAVDHLVFRAIVANDTVDENLTLVRAAKPAA